MSEPFPLDEHAADGLPRWAERLIGWLAPPHNHDVLLGDFAEVFGHVAATEGRGRAQRWLAWQLTKSVPAFLSDGFYFGGVMIGNYVKTAYRNVMKRRFFSALNVGGLAIGMAACLLIFQYVAFEHSFDDFHTQGEALYRINFTSVQNGEEISTAPHTWSALGPAVAETVPEVQAFARYHPNYGTATLAFTDATGTRKALNEDHMAFVDPAFLAMFSFPLVGGEATTALTAPRALLLSETAARRYFGDADPVGKTMEVRAWTSGAYTVRGVFADVLPNSHLQFDVLLPLDDLLDDENAQYAETDGWDWTNFVTYLHLRPGADVAAVEQKISDLVNTQHQESFQAGNRSAAMRLQPIRGIHLGTAFEDGSANVGSAETVYFFTLIALFILILAWVNYVNLSSARAVERAKEVGVRKVVGAHKRQVVAQFLIESALTTLLALGLAVGLAALALPYLNELAGVAIGASIWQEPWLWGSLLLVFGLGALLASLYPAFVLSAFQPVAVLKGAPGKRAAGHRLRQGLVVFQFAASIALLMGTFVVYAQVQHMRNQDLGLDVEQVLVVKRPSFVGEVEVYREARDVFVKALQEQPGVRQVAASGTVPGGGFNLGTRAWRQAGAAADAQPINMTWVSEDFVATYGLDLVAGRSLSTEFASDLENGILINESAVETLGFGTPEAAVGQTTMLGPDSPFQVVGVLKDFYWMSVKQQPGPIFFALSRGGSFFSIKVGTDGLAETLAAVRSSYDAVFPGNPFDYFFVDRYFDEQYHTDRRLGTLIALFSLFALVVACLGLIGLAAYTAGQRTKEIGIRKVMGAGTLGIAHLLVADFVRLILIALLLTTPLVYFAANRWLAAFAVRIDLGMGLFLLPGVLVLLLALLTISYHTVRVARANPVHALRCD